VPFSHRRLEIFVFDVVIDVLLAAIVFNVRSHPLTSIVIGAALLVNTPTKTVVHTISAEYNARL
jgi:hypothetical protein